MKGERTIDDKPFRYGGIERDYDSTLAEFVCDIKGSVVTDTRIRECDEMWEERQ